MAIRIKGSSSTDRATNGGTGAADGWEDVPDTLIRRGIHMDIVGPTGSGRTRLALTAPGPIALAHTAEKIDGLVQQFKREGKLIRLLNFGGVYRGDPATIAGAAGITWNNMRRLWLAALDDDGWAKTLIMDTATEGWEAIRLARFGELAPKGRVDNMYGPVNAEWRSLFKHPNVKVHGTRNVITIHQEKDEYVEKKTARGSESVRTGRQLRAGMKEMGYMPDVVVQTGRDPMTGDFTAVIVKGWFNAAVEQTELRNEDIRFPFIMSLITEMDESEWQ